MALFALTSQQEKQRFDFLKDSLAKQGNHFWPGRLLERAAQQFPQRNALVFQEKTITYQALYESVCQFKTALAQKWVKPKDRILICLENSPEFYIAYYAVWHTGAIVVPVNTFLHAKEIAHIVLDAQPSLIITSTALKEMFAEFVNGNNIPLLLENDIHQKQSSYSREITDIPLDEMTALLYTSGTTGLPKGVMLSGRNIITNILQAAAKVTLEDERTLGILPFFHSFAQNVFIWTSMFLGATVIIVPKIDRHNLLDGLKQKPTVILGVPALFGLLCLLRTDLLDGVKLFVCGGDALPDKIRMAFSLIYGRSICNGYGLTETSPFVSVDLEGTYEPTSNVGWPCYDTHLSIRDDQGKELPKNAIGDLWIKGPQVMMGYYNAPEATEKILKNGWLDSGDMAYIDDRGKIVITGRLKDLIIHKGINIYPQEIENVIMSHPNVLRVGVVGKPHNDAGEVPIAFVQLRSEQNNIEDELKKLCHGHLAAYKIPRAFIVSTDALPLTATNKVDKKELRKRL